MIKDDCKVQAVKIAENNVELQWYLLSPIDGEKVVAFTESYGQTRITEDRVAPDVEKLMWDSVGSDMTIIVNNQKAADADVELYNTLQIVMEAVDGTTVSL